MVETSPRTAQEHVDDEIVNLLSDGKVRTTAEINKAIRLRVPPTDADNERANKRTNETKYDQIVSNTLEAGRGICRAGLIERAGHGQFQITPAGLEHAAKHRDDLALMSMELSRAFPHEHW